MNSYSQTNDPDAEWQPLVPQGALKGRGAVSQIPHRFEHTQRELQDDGWHHEQGDESAHPDTEVRLETARTALSYNDSPDIPFDRSLNPYRGCEHGCIYCYARPTHSYLNLSPGLDFETRLLAKQNLPQLLRRELGRRGYRPAPIAIGTVTDPYQPIERKLRLTRGLIEVLAQARHPFSFITKASAVERDLDLIVPMAGEHMAVGFITITTLNARLARIMEPRAASPMRRLRTLRTMVDAGVPMGVSVAPQIPFINEDMEQVLAAAADAGASSAFYTVLRLPWEVAPLFREWLDVHFPDRAARVMNRIRELRGGRDYDSDFAHRMDGEGIWADLIRQRFEKACRRFGLTEREDRLDSSQFRAPGPALSENRQGALF